MRIAVLGWISLLRSQEYDKKIRHRALETIQHHTKLQPRLLEDLLDSSRILPGRLRLNAVKFTTQGGRVEIRLEYGTQALITVRNTGKGISDDFLPFIFDAFRQADGKITRQFGGLGLGLSIARYLNCTATASVSVVQAMGATFVVKLPLMVAASTMEQIKYGYRTVLGFKRLPSVNR